MSPAAPSLVEGAVLVKERIEKTSSAVRALLYSRMSASQPYRAVLHGPCPNSTTCKFVLGKSAVRLPVAGAHVGELQLT